MARLGRRYIYIPLKPPPTYTSPTLLSAQNLISSLPLPNSSQPGSDTSIKILVFRDSKINGFNRKTCFLISKLTNTFPDDYIPTVYDNTNFETTDDDGQKFNFDLWDTAGPL